MRSSLTLPVLSAVIFSACNWGTPKLASLEGVSQRRKSSPVTSHLILMVRPCWAVLLWNGIFTSAPVRQNTAIGDKIPWNRHEIFVVTWNFRMRSWTNAVIYRRLAVSPSPPYTINNNECWYSGELSETGAACHLLGAKMFFFLEFASSNQSSINEAKQEIKAGDLGFVFILTQLL